MKINLLVSSFQHSLQKGVAEEFSTRINDLRDDLSSGFESPYLSENFLVLMQEFIFDASLSSYSYLAFYWTTLIEKLVTIIQIHEDYDETESSEFEEEMFSFWNTSEFAYALKDLIEDGDIVDASHTLVQFLENQIISFFLLHLASQDYDCPGPHSYNIFPELGDSSDWIKSGADLKKIDLPKNLETFPAILVQQFGENEVTFIRDKELITSEKQNFNDIISIDEFSLRISYSCQKGLSEREVIGKRIATALNRIKTVNPELLKLLFQFTHTVIPVNEPDIVSYSMQELPGVSCINVFNRDDLDLIDDLLHENGHHYLNTFLNQMELIVEDPDEAFYSPWRRAPRPIRGIYHATFTFYWALKVYSDLTRNESLWTKEEWDKIHWRVVQEATMLNYCRNDLTEAYRQELINEEGFALVEHIYALIDKLEDCVALSREKVRSGKYLKDWEELEKTLKEKRKLYHSN